MKPLVLGVDGGNTKTIALVADEDGNVHGAGRAGCSDIYGAPSAVAALDQLMTAVNGALRSAERRPEELAASAFCLAGADWPEDVEYLWSEIQGRDFDRRFDVFNDAFGPLRAGSEDFTGVACVCGTGAAIGARNAAGHIWHASWWLDVHGARELGHKALWSVIHAELGLAPPTAMTQPMLREYRVDSVESLLHGLTRRVTGAWNPEPAARHLVACAEQGDPVAVGIARSHGRALGDYALVAARRVRMKRLHRLVLAGTVLERSTVVARALCERVVEDEPHVEIVAPRLIPAAGSVLIAMDLAGMAVTPGVCRHLLQQQPGSSSGHSERAVAHEADEPAKNGVQD